MKVKIKVVKDGILPSYKTEGSVGADCYARLDKPVIIPAMSTKIIPLGFCVEIPKGYEMQIRPRSGLSTKRKHTSLGTIDSDYRGEVGAIFYNDTNEDFIVNPGDRIAQAVIAPVIIAEWESVEELSLTDRGNGGYGHTGI